VVWARRDIALHTCPTSYVTPESESLVEEFFVRRKLAAFPMEALSVRQIEAFVILENELAAERNDGRHNTRQTA